jgi:hypothetical protein
MQFLNVLLFVKATDPPYLAPFSLNLQSIHLSIVEEVFNNIAPPIPLNVKGVAKFLINSHFTHSKKD